MVILTNHIVFIHLHRVCIFIPFLCISCFWILLFLPLGLFGLLVGWLMLRKTKTSCEKCYKEENQNDDEKDASKNNENNCEWIHLRRRGGCSIISRNDLDIQGDRLWIITNLPKILLWTISYQGSYEERVINRNSLFMEMWKTNSWHKEQDFALYSNNDGQALYYLCNVLIVSYLL